MGQRVPLPQKQGLRQIKGVEYVVWNNKQRVPLPQKQGLRLCCLEQQKKHIHTESTTSTKTRIKT